MYKYHLINEQLLALNGHKKVSEKIYNRRPDLFVKAEHLQELDCQKQTGLVEMVADIEEPLQVSATQRVQYSAVH